MTEQEIQEAREILRKFRKLEASAEWGALRELVENQIKFRDGQVLRRALSGIDKVLEQEFVKGEAAGMATVLALPKQVIDTIRADLITEGVITDETEIDVV